MKYAYEKSVHRHMLAILALLLLCLVFAIIEPIGLKPTLPSFTAIGMLALIFAATLVLYVRLPKMDASRGSKTVGITSLALHPLLLIAYVLFALGAPITAEVGGESFWRWVVMVVLLAATLVYCIVMLPILAKKIERGNTGLMSVYGHYALLSVFLGTLLLYFIFGVVKTRPLSGIDTSQITVEEAERLLIEYLIWCAVFAGLSIIAFLVTLYVSMMVYCAGREGAVIGVRGTVRTSLAIMSKYGIAFWWGIGVTTVMAIVALVSMIRTGFNSLPLFVFYCTILIIRLPSHFYEKRIIASTEEGYPRFVAKHKLFIYAAIILLAYGVASIFIGTASESRINEDASAFLTYAIFVPWAIIKTVLGIVGYVKARKTKDPADFINAALDFIVTGVTITNALFFVGSAMRGGVPFEQMSKAAAVFYLLGLVAILAGIVYVFFVGIRLLVLGIRGFNGKRRDYYEGRKRA